MLHSPDRTTIVITKAAKLRLMEGYLLEAATNNQTITETLYQPEVSAFEHLRLAHKLMSSVDPDWVSYQGPYPCKGGVCWVYRDVE